MKNVWLLMGILAASFITGAAAQCASCFPSNDSGAAANVQVPPAFAANIYSPHGGANFLYGAEAGFQGGSDESTSSADWSYAYAWTSSKDGMLSERKFFSSRNLSLGDHTITFKVTKTNYNRTIKKTETSSITIKVAPAEIKARITSPESEGVYIEGETIRFSAQASGGVPPYRFDWTIPGSAPVGSGTGFEDIVSAGSHEADLVVTDFAGTTAQAHTVFDVEPAANTVYTASIVSPAANDSLREGDAVNLIAYSSGGLGPYGYSWFLDGSRVESIKSIGAGDHTITLEVSDSRGIRQNDSIELYVAGPCDDNGICSSPRENYANCPHDCLSGGKDGYCDSLRDGVCDPDCGRQQDPDCLCNRNGMCEPDYENYLTCPQDCASGSSDKYCDGVKDSRCDPDCAAGRDPDCGTIGNPNYFMLLVLVIIIMLFYLRFIRR